MTKENYQRDLERIYADNQQFSLFTKYVIEQFTQLYICSEIGNGRLLRKHASVKLI